MRRNRAATRPLAPDSRYRSRLVQQVINKVMLHGKKSTAETIVYDALAIVGERTGRNPTDVLDDAIEALTPSLEVRSRRVGGATYQVPVEVPAKRARTLAVRWLVGFARSRGEKSMSERLAREIMDATQEQGGAYKRKDDIYRMARPTRPSPTTAGRRRRAGSADAGVPVRLRAEHVRSRRPWPRRSQPRRELGCLAGGRAGMAGGRLGRRCRCVHRCSHNPRSARHMQQLIPARPPLIA